MILAIDAYALARVVAGLDLNGELEALSPDIRRMADHLGQLSLGEREAAWLAMLAVRDDRPELVKALAAMDPKGPPPKPEAARRFATVADIRRGMSETRWIWPGWIPANQIIGIGGCEGTGKSRFALDLARRIWHGMPWPDSQAATLPAGTPTIWLCADGNQDELAEMLPGFGLPDEAVIFPTLADEPYGGVDLDDPELIGPGGLLEEAIATHKPGFIFIDTLTSATQRDLCAQDQMKPLKAPLVRLAQTYGVTIALLLHLNREGMVLGRRIGGLTRTQMLLECPDPQQSGRLRLWVAKSSALKPPPLGVTMGDAGNEYDHNPPAAPEPNRGGRPPESREKAEAFIRNALAGDNDQKAAALCERWESDGGTSAAFWRARDAMEKAGELVCDRSSKPLILHLNGQEPSSGP